MRSAFFECMYTLFYITFNTTTIVIFHVLLISHFSLQDVGMIVRAFIVGMVYVTVSLGILLLTNMLDGRSTVECWWLAEEQ